MLAIIRSPHGILLNEHGEQNVASTVYVLVKICMPRKGEKSHEDSGTCHSGDVFIDPVVF